MTESGPRPRPAAQDRDTVPDPLMPRPAMPGFREDPQRDDAREVTVTVTIGSVEVVPPPATTPPARNVPQAPRLMSLDDYLAQRARGEG